MTATPVPSPAGLHPVVVVLTAGGGNPWMLINGLKPHFPGLVVIEEPPESKKVLLKRRVRHSGWIDALGQMATMVLSRFGKSLVTHRLAEIASGHGLSTEKDQAIPRHAVPDINSAECLALLDHLKPAVILTVSCRLLRKATLAAIPCPVINMHSAMNPKYRGQMGGYWALANGDTAHFGATVHLVDAGVDTGAVLYQVQALPEKGDSMLTYPALLTAASVDITRRALQDALTGNLRPVATSGPSVLRFNVPIWTWIYNGLTKGIW